LTIGDYVKFGQRLSLGGTSFIFGDYFWCGNDVNISGHGAQFEVGKFSAFADRATFLLGRGNHRIQSLSSYPFGHFSQFDSSEWIRSFDYEAESKTYCRVGHDVWIGVGAVVMANVEIATGAVVSANSVVTQDIPPYAIVGGNPAQMISLRFKPSLIQELLDLHWWDWPGEKICRNIELFTKNLTTRTSLDGVKIVD
jgi:virginiamycin A acetyltransferase